jgi:hypothetical protein
VITEQQMKVLFAQANPIPDASTVPLDEVAAATYLATLETRSSEMTTTETNPVETDKKPDRNWKPLLVAAAAILIAGLAWMVANRGDEVPPATQPPDSVSTELQGTWGAGSLRVTFEGDEYAIVRLDFQPEQPWDRGTYTSDESSVLDHWRRSLVPVGILIHQKRLPHWGFVSS